MVQYDKCVTCAGKFIFFLEMSSAKNTKVAKY